MLKQNEGSNIIKRLEVLNEAAQSALDAILEIQAEQKLITYLLLENKNIDEDDDDEV